MHGRGGLITAAVDGPGGPILAGDHRQRDCHTIIVPPKIGPPGDHRRRDSTQSLR